MRKNLTVVAAAITMIFGASQVAEAGSKGYIISNWVPAMNNVDDSGCPEGKNASLQTILADTLKNQGMADEEVAKLSAAAEVEKNYDAYAPMRGRKDGKPVNVYSHPLSEPDPNVKLDQNKEAFGFNLDGKVSPMNYTDPLTKETGVDNMAARVFGCQDRTRGTLETPPGNWTYRFQNYIGGGHTWLLEITNNSDRPLDLQNEKNVTVTFYRGLQVPVRNSSGLARNVTYTIVPSTEKLRSFKGQIKDGMFLSGVTPQFKMTGSSSIQPVYDFKQARMRITFKPDGQLMGFVGGYLPINMIYFPFGDYASAAEINGTFNVAGIYQALKKNADTDIDKVGNVRTRISQTYQVFAVPAYLIHPERDHTS